MTDPQHYRALESMYLAAPINQIYQPSIEVSEAQAIIETDVDERFHHSAHAVHGSVYFKLLDDAAWFAANSLEERFFLLTTSFTTYLTKPVSAGRLRAVGKAVYQNRSQIIAEAIITDADGNEIGRGNGAFMRSRNRLDSALGFKPDSG